MDLFEPHFKEYYIVNAVITGLLLVASVFLTVYIFSSCQRTNDSARRPFTWLKIASVITILTFSSYIVTASTATLYYDFVTGFYPTPKISTISRVREAANRSADISILIESFGVALILLCIIDLGLSFLYVWNRKRLGHNIIVVITAALAFALAALALAVFGEIERYWTSFYEPKVNGSELMIKDHDGDLKAAKYGRVLMCAFSIAVFVFSLVAAAFTVFVFMVSRSKAILQRNAVLFLACGILFLIRSTYVLTYYMEWFIQGSSDDIPAYIEILDAILDFVPTFAVLCLLYMIGSAKVDGIYSDAEPFEQRWMPIEQPLEQPLDQGMAEQGQAFATAHYDPGAHFLSSRDGSIAPDAQFE